MVANMNFFKANIFTYKLFYVLIMLQFNPAIHYVFGWFFLSCEIQQTLLVIQETNHGHRSYWFNIIEQRLSKSPLFSIVYYYCIRTVTVEEMFVRQDHKESINCYMMGIKITVENIGLHMRFDMTAVSKSTGLGIQEI